MGRLLWPPGELHNNFCRRSTDKHEDCVVYQASRLKRFGSELRIQPSRPELSHETTNQSVDQSYQSIAYRSDVICANHIHLHCLYVSTHRNINFSVVGFASLITVSKISTDRTIRRHAPRSSP